MRSLVNEPTRTGAELITTNVRRRNKSSRPDFYFWLFVTGSCLAFWAPVRNLITFSLTHDYGSHILLIVPLRISLIYLRLHQTGADVHAALKRKETIIDWYCLFLVVLTVML